MEQSREINWPTAITVIVVVVALVGYLLWRNTAPPAPTVPPDQSIAHPFGGGPSGPGMPTPRPTPAARP